MRQTPSAVQQEIGQQRPFRSLSQEGVVALLRTADHVRRLLEDVLTPHGITLPQYNVLRILRGAGPEGLPTLEVADRLMERAPGITRMMDRLEAREWVRRERSTDDRRRVICRITKEGLLLLAGLDAAVDRADDAALAMLSPARQKRLIQLLDAVRRGGP